MADRVGQQLGYYRLLRLLGQGAFATVYLGEHQYLERLAAIKVLQVRMEPASHESFRREARTIAQLQHPHIIGVHDFGISDQTPYLVMEYAPNGTLRARHPRGTPLSCEQILIYVKQVASALDYAHKQHVIHRDIKPENILINAKQEIVLSDFGIAVVQPTLDSLSTQSPAGTPLYMAPEQIQGKPCAASDQYGLGVMVYEWLCGEPPFQGSLFEVLSQHLHKPPPSLRARLKELPPAVEDAVFGALAKDPQQRFPTVQDFATVLSEAFFTTQMLSQSQSVEHSVQEEMEHPLARVRLALGPSAGEQDFSDEATQPRLKTVQRVDHSPELVSGVSLQPAIQRQSTLKQSSPIHQRARASVLQNQNRVRMLRRLRHSYHDLMSQSLQGTAWMELGMASKPDAVQNAVHLLLRMERSTEELLPAGTSITQAYDEAGQELLILGEPGAGKSTLLLNLAEQLLVRAETNETHSLPVILPLSSWAVKRPKLEDWIAEQMSEIYDVPRKLSIEWVQAGRILPLLDGLDEMEETARSACIAAINVYHRDHMAALVVCSRTTEYAAATGEHSRLALQGAVVVQPLTHSDVDAYLERADEGRGQAPPLLAGLRSALKRNSALYDLVTTPLMLNILIMTYQGTSVRDLPNKEAALLQRVWDDYAARMVMRKGNSKRYPLSKTQAWLSWLARQMRDHNQAVFYLEHLQPDWLGARQQLTYAGFAIRLPAIVIGFLVSSLIFLLILGNIANLPVLLQYGVLGGLLGGLWHGPMEELWRRQGQHHMWGKRLIKRLAISTCIGFLYVLSFGFSPPPSSNQWQTSAFSYGGLSSLLLQYLLTQPFHPRTPFENSDPRLRKRVVRFWSAVQGPRVLLVTVVTGLSFWLITSLASGLTVDLRIGLIYGLSIGLSFGLSYTVISSVLGAQMEDIRLTERMRWSWRNLLRGLFNSRHLLITVLLTGIIMILFGLMYGLGTGREGWYWGLSHARIPPPSSLLASTKFPVRVIYGLSIGLSIGLSYWFLLGLSQGMTQERIEDQDRRVANQGIHRSLWNSVIMGIVGGAMIGSLGILSNALIYGPNYWLSQGLMTSISGGLLICVLFGGLAAFRHYVIRFLLWRSRIFPWSAPQFLNDATARFLLRRVGGGYSFAHRLLLDHLAVQGERPTATNLIERYPKA
jgi:serine/threonine protein kinase